MIRTTATPRTIRYSAAAALGLAGAFALAGCAAPAATGGATTDPSADANETTTDAGTYADGSYTAEGSYATPETVETIEVTLDIEGGVVTAVEVVGDPQAAESERYQGEFIGGISDEVVGVPVDEISVSRVAGSSLTSGGFNEALEVIKAEAAA